MTSRPWLLAPAHRPVAAAVVGLLVSAPYWSGGAVWDDHTLIVGHLAQLHITDIPRIWREAVGLGDTGAAYYRPVATTLLAVLGRVSISSIHGMTGLLHGASAALLCILGGRTPVAMFGALVFAVHPIGWEVLGWASALPDALAVTLGLAMLVAAGRGATVGVGLLALAAMLSKESALVWLLAGAVAGRLKRADLAAALTGLTVAVGLRFGVGVTTTPPTGEFDVVHLTKVWLSQLGTILWPLPLTAVRDTHHLSMAAVFCGLGILAAMGVLTWRPDRVLRAAGLVILAAPALALPTTWSSHLAADRYMYAAVAGLGWGLSRIPGVVQGRGVGVLAAAGLGLAVHGFCAPAWQSDLALFGQAVEAQPQSSYSWHFLGHAHAQRGDWTSASEAFDRARKLPHAHPLSVQLAMQAMVLGGDHTGAADIGRSGPTEGLTAEWLAWWARAELGAGHTNEARRLLLLLRQPDGSFDGPPFVVRLMDQIEQSR